MLLHRLFKQFLQLHITNPQKLNPLPLKLAGVKNWLLICRYGQIIRLSTTDEVRREIFNYLFTTKTVGKGTGLGLAIAYQIVVEKHGGVMEVNSILNQGTEFAIMLPL
ncbi:hypothetical protein IQ274_26140 [Nostoc sp. LEGE 12447]|nr:hypothetical protein [Nostoc sp. LEGE 12447]